MKKRSRNYDEITLSYNSYIGFYYIQINRALMNCLAFCTIGFSSVHLIDWLTINWLEIIKLRPSWFYWLDSSVGYAWHSCLESGKERNFNTIWGVLGPFNRKRFENFGKKNQRSKPTDPDEQLWLKKWMELEATCHFKVGLPRIDEQ